MICEKVSLAVTASGVFIQMMNKVCIAYMNIDEFFVLRESVKSENVHN